MKNLKKVQIIKNKKKNYEICLVNIFNYDKKKCK